MDPGPMALFCNKEVLDRAGVGEPPRTWDEYYEAARKTKAAGSYIEADAGDAGFFKSMIWAFGGYPYSASDDGRNVTINLTGDKGTQRFIDYWQKMSERILSIRSFPSGPTNGITAWATGRRLPCSAERGCCRILCPQLLGRPENGGWCPCLSERQGRSTIQRMAVPS